MVTVESVEAIERDRSGIIQAAIERECLAGPQPPALMEELEGFARLVFYEPGWHWKFAESVTSKPHFFMISWDPQA